jgi:hypothetical protein
MPSQNQSHRSDNNTQGHDSLRTRLNQEAARLPWVELLRHFASGSVIAVGDGLDLIEVAAQISLDNKAQVAHWMAAGQLGRVTDTQAQTWLDDAAELWTVVVSPLVLVQQRKASA